MPSDIFYRKAYDALRHWKASAHKNALCVTGARGVGKTTLIREFACQEYEHFLEINFLTDPKAKEIFAGSLQADVLITKLSAYALGTRLVPGKTLIFFDEIDECPQARTAIKFLVQDGRFDYIEAGALSSVRIQDVPSLPVGFETLFTMHPLDFEEFCIANGVQPEVIEYLQECCQTKTPVNAPVHDVMSRLFAAYLVVGGMPQCVTEYLECHDITRVVEIQKSIVEVYRSDITRCAGRDRARIIAIFDAIPEQLEKNGRFILADLNKSARLMRYVQSFNWLTDTGIALTSYNVTQPVRPLKLYEKRNLFRLYLCDTGLMCAMNPENVQRDILLGDLNVKHEWILENAFAQHLTAAGFPLHYYRSNAHDETDFVVVKDGQILPIKVKAGNRYKNHPALNKALAVKAWNLGKAVVYCQGNVEKQGPVTYLPWYMVMFLAPDALPEQMIHKVDLAGLNPLGFSR